MLLYKLIEDFYRPQITVLDLIIFLVFLILIFFAHLNLKEKLLINQNFLLYKLFTQIFILRIICNVFFSITYIYIYKGGDTIVYWENSMVFANLFKKSPSLFFELMLEKPSLRNYLFFDYETFYPDWQFFDPQVCNTIKLVTPFYFLSFGSYITANLILSAITIIPVLKLGLELSRRYPAYSRYIIYSLFFIPSILFWGTSILKDTFTFTALIMIVYCILKLQNKGGYVKYFIYLILSATIIFSIKPYIYLSLLPASMFLVFWGRVTKVTSIIGKVIILPIIIAFGFIVGYYIFDLTSSYLGIYGNMDTIVTKAYDSYTDLKRSYYKGNSYDLGYYEPTLRGMLSKFDVAVIAGIFRPYIWEARNPLMVLSGLENLFILVLTLYTLAKTRLKFFSTIFADSYLMFCFVFSLIFAFSIAISTSNFGALVRFKIPLIPFYVSMLFIVLKKNQKNIG